MASDGSSSGGSLLGGILGGVVGFFFGGGIAGAIKGFTYGSTIGGLLAPPTGPDQFGPRLDSLKITTSTNIATLPRSYGTVAHSGNIIWAKDDEYVEVVTVKKVRTGFFSKTKVTTYSYYFSGAVAFARSEAAAFLRVWHKDGNELVYSATSDDLDTQVASAEFLKYVTFYYGTDDQEVDPLIAEDVGIASCSAYPGVIYMVYDMYPLENYQNNIGNLGPKLEYTTVSADPQTLELICNVPADDVGNQDHYARLHVVSHFNAEGAGLWRLGTGDANGLTSSILGHFYRALPSDDLINIGYLTPLLGGGEPSRNRPCAGKADRGVMCAAAVYINEFAAEEEGGGSDHPYITIPGDGAVYNQFGSPILTISTVKEALDFYLTGTTDADTVYRRMFSLDYVGIPGTPMSRQNFGVSESGFVIQWVINSGFADGNLLWSFAFNDPEMAFTGPITESWYDLSTSFEILMRLWVYDQDREVVDQFIIGGFSTLPNPQTHYVYYQGHIYFVFLEDGIIQLIKIRHFTEDGQVQSRSGSSFNVAGMNPDEPVTLSLVKIGILNDQLIFVCEDDGDCILYAMDIGLDLDGLADNLTEAEMDVMDAAAVLAEFGDNSSDFYNNVSFDFDKMYYCLDGHMYTRKTLTDSETDYGAAPDLILGDIYPAFFNIFGFGNLLAVSTFGDVMDKTGVQFFKLSAVAEPGKITLASIIAAENALVGIESSDLDVTTIDQLVRGYVVSEIGPVRNVLSQLQAIFPFDVIQSGFKNKYVKRGLTSVATVTWQELGQGVSLTQDREMETQLPYKVELTYNDLDLDYQPNIQFAERRTDSKNIVRLNIPIVLTAEEAAQAAEILLNIYHLERRTFAFVLPPTYRNLEPSDIITLAMKDVTYVVRLTNIHYLANGQMECTAKQHRATVYVSTAPGASGSIPKPTTIPSIANPVAGIFDMPVIYDSQNTAGYSAVMASLSDSWPGGTLHRTTDNGGSWQNVGSFSVSSTWGICLDTLGAHGGHVIDEGSSLTVKPYNGEFASVTEAQFLNEETLLVYGMPGRWEIIGYKTAVDNEDGTYTLSYLMRGKRGTEQYTGTHEVNDYFALISSSKFIGASISNLDTLIINRAITNGRELDSASNIGLTYAGVNLTPYAPVDAFGVRDSSDNLTGYFARRSRLNNGMTLLQLITNGGVPIGEATESYEIDILDGATVVRTISATSETFEYSAADQITDFGSEQAAIDINIYQISATVGRGYAGAFTV